MLPSLNLQNDFVGSTEIGIEDLCDGKEHNSWWGITKLKKKGKELKMRGEVRLNIQFKEKYG